MFKSRRKKIVSTMKFIQSTLSALTFVQVTTTLKVRSEVQIATVFLYKKSALIFKNGDRNL